MSSTVNTNTQTIPTQVQKTHDAKLDVSHVWAHPETQPSLSSCPSCVDRNLGSSLLYVGLTEYVMVCVCVRA